MSEFTENRQKSLKHLVEAGADPGVQDNFGRTALRRFVAWLPGSRYDKQMYTLLLVWSAGFMAIPGSAMLYYSAKSMMQTVAGADRDQIVESFRKGHLSVQSGQSLWQNILGTPIEPVATDQQQGYRYDHGKNSQIDNDLPRVHPINKQDNRGMTLAHLLVEQGLVNELSLALSSGSELDIDISNFAGDTPLFIAVKESRGVGVVGLLLSHGARVNIFDSNGNSPLHLAVMADDPKTAKLLVAHGADINAVNLDGKRPVDLIPSQGIKRDGSDKDYSKRAWANLFAEAHVSKYTEERQRTNADHSFENIQAYASTSGLIGGDISIYDMFVEKLDEANDISVNEARDQMLAASRVKQGIAYRGKSAHDRNGDSQHSRS